MARFHKDMTAVEYFTLHVERYRTFRSTSQPGAKVVKQCIRGVTQAEVKRFPQVAGCVFFFNWDTVSNKVLNPVFLTNAQLKAMR